MTNRLTQRLWLKDPERCDRCKVRGRVIRSVKKVGRGRVYRLRRYQCRTCLARWSSYLSRLNPVRVKVQTV